MLIKDIFLAETANLNSRVAANLGLLLVFLALLLLSPFAQAQSQTYRVFIDADVSETTGCSVSLSDISGSQTFTGFEYRLDVSVTGTTPNVTVGQTLLATCTGSSFGTPQALGSSSHPLAITDIGTAVTDHIELGIPLTNLTISGNQARLVIAAAGDYVATLTPSGSGPIIMPLMQTGTHAIPLLPPLALALLGMVVGFVGFRSLRKQQTVTDQLNRVVPTIVLPGSTRLPTRF